MSPGSATPVWVDVTQPVSNASTSPAASNAALECRGDAPIITALFEIGRQSLQRDVPVFAPPETPVTNLLTGPITPGIW